jgi:hypothetical protein
MDKPNQPYPNPPATSAGGVSTPSQMPMFLPDPSIKGLSFDQLLSQRGVRMIHHKAIPCFNLESTNFQAHNPDCSFCDGSGIYYYSSQEIWGTFTGNSIQKTFEAHGVWEVGSAVVTLPTSYPDGTQADFNTYDRLELPDFTVRLYELKDYEPTNDNMQRLRYPIEKIEFASYIVDNQQTILQQGVDFNLTPDGKIQWVDGHQPPYFPNKERGAVVGFAYFAKPIYIVLQSLRELRITQEMVNGVKQAKRLPQQVLVKRDFLVGTGEKFNAAPTNI